MERNQVNQDVREIYQAYEQIDYVSGRLVQVLVQCYRDPRQAAFWAHDKNGMEIMELAVRTGFLPPAAIDEPRKYVAEIRFINRTLVALEEAQYITAAPGKIIREAARPTYYGIQFADYLNRPWWRKAYDRVMKILRSPQ